MSRLVTTLVSVTVGAIFGLMVSRLPVVGSQEIEAPAPVAMRQADDLCEPPVSETAVGTPQAVATPAAEVSFDGVYLDLVIPHTNLLANLAGVTAERAEHDALRAFGSAMATDLSQRGRRLEVWRSLWFAEQPALTGEQLGPALDDLARANPGRGGLPGGFEMLGMSGAAAEACESAADDLVLLNLLIEAVNADLLLARAAVEQAEHDELRQEAGAIAIRDQRWLEALIAYRELWYESGATPAASPAPSPVSAAYAFPRF